MATEMETGRSRRAVLTAGVTALAATVVGSAARPLPVRAASDHIVYQNDQNDNVVLTASSLPNGPNTGGGTGVFGTSASGNGVSGLSSSGAGVHGSSVSGHGVDADSLSGNAIHGTSSDGSGVFGHSDSASGVHGESNAGTGVYGLGGGRYGVFGFSFQTGVFGQSFSRTAVAGYSGNGTIPSVPAVTGVNGVADQGTSSVGVRGTSPAGRGGVFKGGSAQLKLVASSRATHPASGQLGDLFLDKNKRLWFCKGGTTWTRLA